jgi:hypothetical protein
MLGTDFRLIAGLFATQLVIYLYGAGVRRPFGSLATISDLPWRLRRASVSTKVADCIFVVFAFCMWAIFLTQMNLLILFFLAVVFSIIADSLSHQIRIVPSFFISVAFFVAAIFLVLQYDGTMAPTFASVK